MKGRSFLAYAIAVSLAEQAVLFVVALWVLPAAGVEVPILLVVGIAVGLAVQSVVLTRINLRTLDRRPLFSPDTGARGKAVSNLDPSGYVRVDNELWLAVTDAAPIAKDEPVVVKSRDGMRLVVTRDVPTEEHRPSHEFDVPHSL